MKYVGRSPSVKVVLANNMYVFDPYCQVPEEDAEKIILLKDYIIEEDDIEL